MCFFFKIIKFVIIFGKMYYQMIKISVLFSFFCLSSVIYAFEKQIGQIKDQNSAVNENVLFSTESNGMLVFLTRKGFSYQIINQHSKSKQKAGKIELSIESLIYDFNRVDIEFLNFNKDFTIEMVDPISVSKSYYLSGDSQKSSVELCNRVIFKNVYRNIDVEFIDADGFFKYNFIIRPGGDIDDIELKYNSDASIEVYAQEIVINTPIDELKDAIPASFIANTQRQQVDVVYVQKEYGIGYELKNNLLNPNDTLIIDPMPQRFFGSYYGGLNDEFANEITIDQDGYTYITGHTSSLNNIATTGTYQGSFSAVFDAFVAKFTPDGNRVWGTYFGGNSFDRAYGIDYNNGFLYIVGNSNSSNFATVGAHQEFSIDNDDAFLAKFDTTGNRIWCTYYGGDLHDFAAAVITDSDENIYLTGHTLSSFNIATAGAHLENYSGNSAAFLAKFTTNGVLVWGTYFGNSFEEGWGITLDSNEDPIFSGFTSSISGIATAGSHQSTIGGGMDAFLTKFNQNGVQQWGTYFGGANNDFGYEIDCDSQDNIYFVGGTSSSNNIYFNSGFQSTPTSIDDGFVAKFDNGGSILWGTYIGGNEADYLYGVKNYVDDGVLITGLTQSAENIATSGAFQDDLGGQYDALVMKLSTNGDLQWGTYYGGSLSDEGRGIAINPSNAYFTITGYTLSNSGISSINSFQETFGGGNYDAFIAKFCAPIFPSLDYGFSGDLCTGDNEVLGVVSPGFFNSFEWSDGSTSSTIDLTSLPIGSYTFYLNSLDSNNCPAYSDTLGFDKLESTPLEIQQNEMSYCAGDDLILWSEDLFDSYIWSTNSSDTTIQFQNMNAGTYTFSLQATNSDGCTSYDTIEIVVNPTPSPSLNVQGSANFCLGESVDVGVSGTFSSYDWYNGSNSSFVTLVEEDSVWVYVENQFGCGAYSDTIFIDSDVLTPEVNLLTTLPICEDSLALFGVNNSYDDYVWMNGVQTPTLSLNLGAGTHYVYVNVSNQCGGSAQSDSIEIVILPTTQASIEISGLDSLCIGEEYNFSVDGEFNNVLWQNDFIGETFDFTTNNAGEFTFVVETIDTNGCPSYDTLIVNFEDCNLYVIENGAQNSWSVYPNPSSDKVYIEAGKILPFTITIVSSEGKVVESKMVKDSDYIDISKYAKGVYTIIPDRNIDSLLPIKIVVQ